LEEPDDVAVCVLHRCDQFAAADVADRLLGFCAGFEERLEALVDVVDVPSATTSCNRVERELDLQESHLEA
jgi:hypothetical protein